MKRFLILIIMATVSQAALASSINYSISFQEAKGHYVDVEMQIDGNKNGKVELLLPVWAPGSYLVREFSRHLDRVTASDGKTSLKVSKTTKNSWVIENPSNAKVTVKYRVYAFELTVRTSFVDESHAYLNGSNIFMLVPGREKDKHIVKVNPLSTWAKISVALPSKAANTYEAANYDLLADSPFEIGNHQIIEFEAAGVKHSVAMVGPGNYDAEKIKTDFTKIVQEAKSIFGTHPCSEYLFIVHNVAAGGGGLEHLNSTTVQVNRFAYSNENTYRSFLGLIAHEYFHLWNVKRLRPAALGPFNYSEENYTTMLWVAEGFTAFYDNWIVRRAGLMNTDKYLEIVANEYSAQSNLPGDKVQALAEASFDSWIKYYRRNENSNNTQVSYYDKGSIVASLMNLMIIKNSNGQKNLDDLMRLLYNEYYQKQGRGYTDEEFKKAAENLCGQSLDDFYAKYINGTEVIPYAVYLELAGLKLTNLNATKEEPYLGLGSSVVNGKLTVTSVANGSPAYKAGLSVNDELIAMDNYRIDDLTKFMALKKPNDKVSLVYARDGMLFNTNLQIEKNSAVKYKIDVNPDSKDEVLRKKWLY